MANTRAFIAVNPTLALVETVRPVQQRLITAAREAEVRVLWVPLPNMHITLKFLGQVPEESLPAVGDQLRLRLEALPSVQLELRGLGCFPSVEQPRVIWVGAHSDGDALTTLAAEINGCLEELGFAPEERPFHGHLTLGRIKPSAPSKAPGEADKETHEGPGLQPLLEELGDHEFGPCTLHEAILYKSELSRAGAEYTPLARFPLAGRSVD